MIAAKRNRVKKWSGGVVSHFEKLGKATMLASAASDHCIVCTLRERASDEPLDSGIATFVNPYSYLRLRDQAVLLQQFSRVYFDGSLMVLLAKLMGIRAKRRSFDYTSFAMPVFDDAAATGKSMAIVGSTDEELELATSVFSALSPGLRIELASAGYFSSPGHRERRLRSTVAEAPELIIVGMGTPNQERFLTDLWAAGWRGTGYTCGGFIHQTAAALGHYYPRIIDRLHLRWAYRMYREPNVRRRYILEYPRALIMVVFDSLKCWIHHWGTR